MSFKKLLCKTHLLLGLASGLVVLIVSLSGCLYAFEKEIREMIHRDLYVVNSGDSHTAALSEILEKVKSKYPKQSIKNIIVPESTSRSLQINLKNKTSLFINPSTGEIMGSLDMETEFFAVVLKLHRNLCLGEVGKTITGISALVFLVMLISGIILWWPKRSKYLKQKLLIKKEAHRQRRLYDLHSVLGFYASFILLFSVLTGLIWSFKWVEKSMYWVTNSKKEEKKPHSEMPAAKTLFPLDSIATHISETYPAHGFFIVFPEDKKGVYRFSVVLDESGFYRKMDHFFFDQYSGKHLSTKLFQNASAGEKVKSANYNIHTGKAFGLLGECLMFFASLIAASLPVTGFLMWNNKRRKKV